MARASGEVSYFEVDIVLPKHTFDFHISNREELWRASIAQVWIV